MRELHLELIGPIINLFIGGFLGDAILFLNFARQDFTLTIDLQELVIGQLAPFLLDFAAELLSFASRPAIAPTGSR